MKIEMMINSTNQNLPQQVVYFNECEKRRLSAWRLAVAVPFYAVTIWYINDKGKDKGKDKDKDTCILNQIVWMLRA